MLYRILALLKVWALQFNSSNILFRKQLLFEVLTPIGYNMMVTPKEVDFLIEKLSNLIGNGINETLHNIWQIKMNMLKYLQYLGGILWWK